MTLEEIKELALPACKKFGVNRIYVFGSTIHETSTALSDVDLLVEFSDPTYTPARRFF